MTRSLLVFGAAAGLVLAAAAASAGTCSAEIESLQKTLSSSDAGMGPIGSGTVGAMGTVTETGKTHPPTDARNQATEGKAASSEDVLTKPESGHANRFGSGCGRGQSGTGGAAEASDALQRAPVRPGRQ
jgi:hypothetical protein